MRVARPQRGWEEREKFCWLSLSTNLRDDFFFLSCFTLSRACSHGLFHTLVNVHNECESTEKDYLKIAHHSLWNLDWVHFTFGFLCLMNNKISVGFSEHLMYLSNDAS